MMPSEFLFPPVDRTGVMQEHDRSKLCLPERNLEMNPEECRMPAQRHSISGNH
jgi:hypothetical protein